MEWNRSMLEQTLHDIRGQERIPKAENRDRARARLDAASVQLFLVSTRLGWFGVAQSSRGIISLKLPSAPPHVLMEALQREFPRGIVRDQPPLPVEEQLKAYAEGRTKEFQLDVDLSRLNPFQHAVLTVTRRIPCGETRSYGWVAKEVGRPKAARAVGHALATNPIPIIIPCHRVLAFNGRLGGYGGGLAMKRALLQLEGAFAVNMG